MRPSRSRLSSPRARLWTPTNALSLARLPTDLEWDPYIPKLGGTGGPGKAALVQVCDADTILLVHVAKMSRASFSLCAPASTVRDC